MISYFQHLKQEILVKKAKFQGPIEKVLGRNDDSDSSSNRNMKETHASSSEMEFIFFGNPSRSDSNNQSDDSDWPP